MRTPYRDAASALRARHRGALPRPRTLAALRALLLGFSVLAAAGCATAPSPAASSAALELRIDAADRVWLGDHSYTIRDLPAALRRHRVPLKQSLLIHTPDNEHRALFVRLSSTLRSAGYSRFVFVGAPHAESHVVDPNRPKSGRPAATRRVR